MREDKLMDYFNTIYGSTGYMPYGSSFDDYVLPINHFNEIMNKVMSPVKPKPFSAEVEKYPYVFVK